jgi:hypothetical protein
MYAKNYSITNRQVALSTLKHKDTFFPMCDQSLFSLLNTKRREGGFEGGIAKDPKGKNTEILLQPPMAEKIKTKMSKN